MNKAYIQNWLEHKVCGGNPRLVFSEQGDILTTLLTTVKNSTPENIASALQALNEPKVPNLSYALLSW